MSFQPYGMIIPVITPITPDGAFNEPVYRRLMEFFVANGIHGVFPFGTTGEFYAFDEDFYTRVLDVTLDAVRGRMHVYAGANHITTAGAIRSAKIAEKMGVDCLSVLTPMFISQTQGELEAFYRAIAESVSLPIVIYNNKPKTNINVDPETVALLARLPNIVGVKDSTGDMTNSEEYIRLTRHRKDFSVLMGRDSMIYAGLCYGAKGAIASCANVMPRLAVDIVEKYAQGDYEGALEAQFKVASFRVISNLGTFPVVIKEALEMIGFDVGPCVPPIAPLCEANRQKVRAKLAEIGVLAQ